MELIKLKIGEIVIRNRVREDLGDLSTLQKSIQEIGLLFPVVVNQNHELISGYRRLLAVQMLGQQEIDALAIDCTDRIRTLDMQCQENLCRKPLTPQELDKEIEWKRKFIHETFQKNQGFFTKTAMRLFRFLSRKP